MIVHLFSDSFFVYDYAEFLTEYFDPGDHKIILYRMRDFKRTPFKTDMIVNYNGKKDIFKLRSMLLKADRIILHSLGMEFEMLMLFSLSKCICRKSLWVIWGNDLYCKADPVRGLMGRYVEHMRKKVIGNLAFIGGLVTGDYETAVKWYKTNARLVRVNYCVPKEQQMLDSFDVLWPGNHTDAELVKIIVGNNGTASNRHLLVLKKLQKWKDSNIHIYVPLSYGDGEYIKEVSSAYKEEFGDKVTIMDKILPLEDYMRTLSDMDIAIYDSSRQQGLGNIFVMMYMGKKIYVNSDNSIWDELVKREGGCLFDSAEIEDESFLTFTADKDAQKINRDIAFKLHYDTDYLTDCWKKAFYS